MSSASAAAPDPPTLPVAGLLCFALPPVLIGACLVQLFGPFSGVTNTLLVGLGVLLAAGPLWFAFSERRSRSAAFALFALALVGTTRVPYLLAAPDLRRIGQVRVGAPAAEVRTIMAGTKPADQTRGRAWDRQAWDELTGEVWFWGLQTGYIGYVFVRFECGRVVRVSYQWD